ncbi:glycerate kinase [Haloferula chungangensis]|uniref:Glycerate kinase n=1 Tax=Haloferula chungangensis TaxID=1048331 RepID=A0ABW2LAU9_9BACT
MTRRILIAPDKFKGSLTALQAAEAIAAGIALLDPAAECDLCPIADGGEGFMESLAAALKGRWIPCPAVDALGREIDSRYVLAETPEGPLAVMEMAETAGMWRLKADERNPLVATTRGVGLQMAHAVREHGVQRIILGLGGSATNDAGCGMASAIGVNFLNDEGKEIDPIPVNLECLSRVDIGRRMVLPEITAACDVDNPLLGTTGATSVFSAQKGASDEAKVTLEGALEKLVQCSGGELKSVTPGAGAAGGLGFGLLQFADAKLVSGFELLADLTGLEARVRAVNHVVTGEGSIDFQSLSGKGPVALARMARSHGVAVTGFCGMSDEVARESGIFDSLHALADGGLPLETLIERAGPLLTEMVLNSQFFEARTR